MQSSITHISVGGKARRNAAISGLIEGTGNMTEEGGDGDYLSAVGLRVRLFRMARALSQDELARLASVSRVTLGAIERGDHASGLLTYRKLARALGRDIGEVVAEGEVLPGRR
jgi:DNA-binding XRE family transcriptional regulator